jgi:hypothetical protein
MRCAKEKVRTVGVDKKMDVLVFVLSVEPFVANEELLIKNQDTRIFRI